MTSPLGVGDIIIFQKRGTLTPNLPWTAAVVKQVRKAPPAVGGASTVMQLRQIERAKTKKLRERRHPALSAVRLPSEQVFIFLHWPRRPLPHLHTQVEDLFEISARDCFEIAACRVRVVACIK